MSFRTQLAKLFTTRRSLDIDHWGFEVNQLGHLVVDGCDVVATTKKYDTPLHLVSRQKLLENCARIKKAATKSSLKFEIFYSYKTNCVPGILALIHEQSIGAEVISPYELWLALRLGLPGAKVIFNGPHKTEQSLRMAVDNQVKLINLDSLTDIHRLLKVCKKTNSTANVGIRICPTSGWRAQFGLDIDNGEAAEGLKLLADNADLAILKGVHLHLGSQVTDLSLYARVITDALTYLYRFDPSLFAKIEYIDAGGGFGVPTVREIGGLERKLSGLLGLPFAPPQPNESPPMERFITTISDAIQSVPGINSSSLPTAIIEPGRLLTSNSQVLLLGVRAVKRRNPPAVILDGGKMNITYPASFEYHEAFAANKMHHNANIAHNLVGRTCTPSDAIYAHKLMPPLEVGDLIALMDAGAYFSSFSNSFAFPRPPIVLADNGETRILRERETFEAIIARDTTHMPL